MRDLNGLVYTTPPLSIPERKEMGTSALWL